MNFDNDNSVEIVGATHGDSPQFYIMNNDSTSYQGWPKNVPDNSWTYNAPTVVKIDNEWNIFMSRPISSEPLDMLYGWDKNGNMLPGFPIVKAGGLEGYISVADITNDNDFELVFGSNLKDEAGFGFIHAYKIGSSTELSNFPLRPKGFTFMNGVCIGDVDGNGKTNLVALSYDNNFGESPDSIYINVYDLDIPYNKSKVLWGTYKGSNTRTGDYNEIVESRITAIDNDLDINLFPNPVNNILTLNFPENYNTKIQIIISDVLGKIVYQNNLLPINNSIQINVNYLEKGFYFISSKNKLSKTIINKFLRL